MDYFRQLQAIIIFIALSGKKKVGWPWPPRPLRLRCLCTNTNSCIRIHTHMHICTHLAYVCTHTYMYICIHARTHTHTHAHAHTQPECSLHLHLNHYGYQSILSQKSAVGLLMAHGNLGSSLSGRSRETRLYFSRDGGFTWFEVATGRWEFRFAALGSIVVTIKKNVFTNAVRWSCNEGSSWKEAVFAPNTSGINVIGLITDIKERNRHAMYDCSLGLVVYKIHLSLSLSLSLSI